MNETFIKGPIIIKVNREEHWHDRTSSFQWKQFSDENRRKKLKTTFLIESSHVVGSSVSQFSALVPFLEAVSQCDRIRINIASAGLYKAMDELWGTA